MKCEILAVAGILWRNGEFLAAERPEGKIMAGYWEFPGGKIEPGETPYEALCRELTEELGVCVRSAVLWRTITHQYEHGNVTLHVFHVPEFSGEPTPLEGQRIAWTTPEKSTTLNFLPVDEPLLHELAAGHRE
ncbi:MAG: CTP pyrophosphohydrolase [Desulfovibrio sp.]